MGKAAKKPDVPWQQILCSALACVLLFMNIQGFLQHHAEAGYQLTGNAAGMQNVEKKTTSLCVHLVLSVCSLHILPMGHGVPLQF